MKKNPYTVLLERAKKFAFSVEYAHCLTMWTYPKEKLGIGWSLTDLAERVQAADQLGYDVKLVVENGSLHVRYVKRPAIPQEFKV